MSESRIVMNGVVLPFPQKAQRPATWTSLAIRALASPGQWLRQQNAARQLAALDDHMLRDIGVARTDIERAARRGRE